jgi:hypothetical protein
MSRSRPQKTIPDASANFRLPLPTLRKLDFYCAANDVTRSQAIRKLIAGFEPLKQIPDELATDPKGLSYPGWLIR